MAKKSFRVETLLQDPALEVIELRVAASDGDPGNRGCCREAGDVLFSLENCQDIQRKKLQSFTPSEEILVRFIKNLRYRDEKAGTGMFSGVRQ